MSDNLKYGLELAGTVSSLIYLYYSIREKILCWPWGILASAISIFVFFVARLYADMGLQFYYLFISAYGWYFWIHGKKDSGNEGAVITRTTKKQWFFLIIAVTGTYFLILIILLYVPSWLQIERSSMPFLDAFTTAAGIIATWMLARKLIEHWLIWIVVDMMSMGMYLYKGLYFYSFLFLVYTAGAVLGYIEWKKSISLKYQTS